MICSPINSSNWDDSHLCSLKVHQTNRALMVRTSTRFHVLKTLCSIFFSGYEVDICLINRIARYRVNINNSSLPSEDHSQSSKVELIRSPNRKPHVATLSAREPIQSKTRDNRTGARMNSRFETSHYSTNTLDLCSPNGSRVITRFGSKESSLDQYVSRRSSFFGPHTHTPAEQSNQYASDNLRNSWLSNETTDQRNAYDQKRHDQIHLDVDLYLKLMLPPTSVEPGRSSSVFSSASRKSKRESPKVEESSDSHSSLNRGRAASASAAQLALLSQPEYRKMEQQCLRDEYLFQLSISRPPS
ncbi:hypothetical protein BJ742DRAFT_744343 [Cladochytrium replicatum]|nr:hypothetical protein BJ742DRAFT_744343 [Cladochytrium replicatum]